jgi:uncharacterized protein YndB with AHSA1/START domain
MDVYKSLTEREKLADWWTTNTSGIGTSAGDVLEFRFDGGSFDMQVVSVDPLKQVVWRVSDGPEEWVGTNVQFDLKSEDGYTIIVFKHEGWRAPVEFMHHCSTKWAIFLMSLKSLHETGEGAPHPGDVKIDNWN